MKIIKKSKTKIPEKLRKKYGACEHDNVSYKELAKGYKELFIAHRRVCRDNDRKGKILLVFTKEKTKWNKLYVARLTKLKANYDESIKKWETAFNAVTADRDEAYNYNTELLKKNKDCIKKNREFVKANKQLLKRCIEITRAYNGIAEMGKFAKELGINIKEHQEKLPEYEFNQKHTLLESGRVNHSYTFLPKIKKKGDK